MSNKLRPEFIEIFERARRARELQRARGADDPLMWMVVGAVLVAFFILVLSIHWFAR